MTDKSDPLHLPSRSEIKAMIRMELWHVLGRIFKFTPQFIHGATIRSRLVIDWRCVPPEMYKILNCQDAEAMRDEIKKNPTPKIRTFPSKRDRLFIEQKGVCIYCKRETDRKNWSVDHIVPVSRSGKRTPDNEVGACRDCNSNKSNKDAQDFINSSYIKGIIS